MNSQKFVVHQSPNWQHVERVHEQVVGLFVIFGQHLDSEIEESGHLSSLMVASEQEDGLWIIQLD